MLKHRLLTAAFAIAVVLLIISASIALPIYIRPFYYAHIGPLDLVESTGKSAEEIRAAYDEVLDYLTLPNREFGTGAFAYSEAGKSHFVDCKVLFTLDTVVLFVSLGLTALLGVLAYKRVYTLSRPFGYHVLLTSGAATLSFFVLIAGAAAINFDAAFEIFHLLFFPGKDNWLFSPREDEIILALPQTFFMNCAILIAAAIIISSIGCVVYGKREKRRMGRED